jgi:hypothetical protein
MQKSSRLLLATVLALSAISVQGNIITVTTEDNSAPGGLASAIRQLADGDTIAFNIPGSGPQYIQVPPDGFPLITKNNITIDGYSQPGASPNTASIHAANNAVLQIVLTATNGNALSMYSACTNSWGADIPQLGFGDDEQAILGFFHATNATVKGLAILATPFTSTSQGPPGSPGSGPYCKALSFAANSVENGGGMCQNWHVSGCWFGIDPATKQVAHCQDVLYSLGTLVSSPAICIASYRTRNADSSNPNFNIPGTIGVAAGSANPQAEFNVFVTGYGFDSEGKDYRISGNFWGVLPDGVTSADMGVLTNLQQSDGYIEVGRDDSNLVIGTDGDGVNDDQEGNVFGPMTAGGTCINLYSDPRTNIVVAGNYFSVDITGNAFAGANTNANPLVDTLGNVSSMRFGSDFNGVSDALEANKVVNALLFKHDQPANPSNASWVSMRGNSLQNTTSTGTTRPPLGDGQTEGQNIYAGFIDITTGTGSLEIIPVIGAGTTATTLVGTCGQPVGSPYTRLIVDLYEADTTPGAEPQGVKWLARFTDNSPADLDTNVGSFNFALPAGLVASGKKVTITVTYSSDTAPTIGPVQRVGNRTTVSVTGGTGPIYGILQSSVVTGPYTYIAAQTGSSATFADNNPQSSYRAAGGSATGQTSPFSDVFTIP